MLETCDRCHSPTEGYDCHQYKCKKHTLCYRCSRRYVGMTIDDDCYWCEDTWRFSEYVSENTIRVFFGKSVRCWEDFVDYFTLGSEIQFESSGDFVGLVADEMQHNEKLINELRASKAAVVAESERKDVQLQEKDTAISYLQRCVKTLRASKAAVVAELEGKDVQLQEKDTAISYLQRCVKTLRAENELLRANASSQVTSALEKIRDNGAKVDRLMEDLRNKEREVERVSSTLKRLAESVHGSFRCVFCHDFAQTVMQCVSCRNVTACEGCLPAFLSGRAICPLDRTTNLAVEENLVVLTLPRGVIDLSEITTSILFPEEKKPNMVMSVDVPNVPEEDHPDGPVADP